HVVADGAADEALARALMARYGKGRDSVLPAALGLSKAAEGALDRDRDGKLSPAELARFADRPADVTLTGRLGNRSGAPLVVLGRDRPLPEGLQVKMTDEGATLQLGTTRLDLRAAPGQTAQAALVRNLRAQLKTIFRRLDEANRGYLERKDFQ